MLDSGPMSTAVIGSPVVTAAIAAVKRSTNASWMSAWTIIRLPQMHDWPLFWMRAVTAALTAAARSADGMTTNGSDPPSSRTTFLRCLPATSATAAPAPSLPVSVTAATRGSATTAATSRDGIARFWNRPLGAPASPIISTISPATP